jgi:hypothetical protein
MAIRFDGVNQYLNLGRDLPFLNNKPGGTLMAWVKLNAVPSGVPTICGLSVGPPTGPDTGSSRLSLEINSSQRIAATVRALDSDPGSGILPPVSPAVQVTLGQWHHCAVSVDFTTRVCILFKDGVNVYTAIATSATAGNTSATNCRNGAVAANEDGLSGFFPGEIEDVRFYDRVMHEIEMMTIYTAMGRDGIVDMLDMRLPMEELGAGQTASITVADISTTQRSGIPVNSPVYAAGIATSRKRPAIPIFIRNT